MPPVGYQQRGQIEKLCGPWLIFPIVSGHYQRPPFSFSQISLRSSGGIHGNDPATLPYPVLGQSGSRMLSSPTRLVLPPPILSSFHARSTQAALMLTLLLEQESGGPSCPGPLLSPTPPDLGQPLHQGMRFRWSLGAGLSVLSLWSLPCPHLPDSSYVCLGFQVQICLSPLMICEI